MAQDGGVLDFWQRFHSLQAQQNSSDTLIHDLLVYSDHVEKDLSHRNKLLAQEIDEMKLDLRDNLASRRELQKQKESLQDELIKVTQDYDSLRYRNPYVAILVDGDGLIFSNKYIQQGNEGGKKAAYALRAAVLEQCRQYTANEWEVSAKIVANLSGLAKAMMRDGVVHKAEDVRDFFLGFTQANPSFDFVDVGHGKERADSKIKENTRWHLQNSNCKQILLGISHDAGYAPFLDEILRDDTTRRKVTILEGVPIVRDLVATQVNAFKMHNDLFRTDKLIDRTSVERAMTMDSAAATASSTVSPLATTTSATTAPTSPPKHSASATSNGTSSPFASYSGMAQKLKPATPPPVVSLPLASRSTNLPTRKKTTPGPSGLLERWNPGDRGLDELIVPNREVLEQIKKRRDNDKICNNHFLRGPCAKGSMCPFVHDYNPSDDELTVISYLARLNPCTRGQDCDAEDCIYGHHCQSMKGDTCLHPYCKFPDDAHPPGTKRKNFHIDKNY